ncbi:hypothetical protein AZ54_24225 [Xanthomonas oryzae pv. oryzae PXO86]|nr:hypothetical protein AZ54_24225 [Xanthomonas oryzae pv. oryzae PXO86]
MDCTDRAHRTAAAPQRARNPCLVHAGRRHAAMAPH